MPYGEHRVQCIHCGRYYNCGDCVTFTCYECDQAGHRGLSLDCPVCSREADERRARIDAAIAARSVAADDRPPGVKAEIEGALAKCRGWRMTDEEIEELLR